jgi:hypothetical protein
LNDINDSTLKWIRRHANDIQADPQAWNKLKSENPDLANEVEQNWILEAALPKIPPPVKKDPFPVYNQTNKRWYKKKSWPYHRAQYEYR